ncbi:hypothetical protein QEG73_23045 [Chitinophagaceae bacterium 26-R-25]|nr:hypothetical protein [Chitinophagaceae bacterium 26-R-25]
MNVPLSQTNKIQYRPCAEQLQYGIMYTIENGNDVNTIKYEASIRLADANERGYVFFIDRTSKIFINDEEPDLMTDVLATTVGGVLYPLKICIDHACNLHSIHNFDMIRQRWESVKELLRNDYEGELIDKYIAQTELSLREAAILLQCLKADWFLASYFCNLYGAIANGKKQVAFSIMENAAPVKYLVDVTRDENLTAENLIKLSHNGSINDAHYTATSGNYRAQYFLDPYYHTVDTAFIECDMKLYNEKKITVLVSRLNAPEQYQTAQQKASSYNVTDDMQVVAVKKTFWQRLDDKLSKL